MRLRLPTSVIVLTTVLTGCSAKPPELPVTPEARIVSYLAENIRPGQEVVVSELLNEVFRAPEDQAALGRLYNTFLKIPLFLVEFEARTGAIPTLDQISEQFAFTVPGEADVLLRVMESDPRIPHFLERDSETREIVSLDPLPIRNHPLFGQQIERSLAGWEGRVMPPFVMETFDGGEIRSSELDGRPYMVYVWFSNCPPCVATSPLLVDLYERYRNTGFEIVAANADRVLGLPYDDTVRSDYVQKLGIDFVTAHISEDVQNAFGGVAVFPTMFFVDSQGRVVRNLVSFQEESVLEDTVRETLAASAD